MKEGYQVAGVASGEEALAAVEAKPPDLVLLDLMLPGLDGLSVCRKLKANPLTEPIPIVMLTAKGEEVDIVTGLNMGADDYVTKPFSPKVLLARVQAVRSVMSETDLLLAVETPSRRGGRGRGQCRSSSLRVKMPRRWSRVCGKTAGGAKSSAPTAPANRPCWQP